MVGYSQGADVMSVSRAPFCCSLTNLVRHNGMVKLDPALYGKIVGLVMFGDPG